MIFEDTKMTWHATNSYKFHVICSEIKYIYHYFVRYKHDLTCNQFIQISCNLFWNIYIYTYQYFVRYKNDLKCNQIYAIFMSFVLKNESVYIYISSYSKIQKWSEMQLIRANFMSIILKLYVYIYIMIVKDTKIILNMQPIHANFTSLVLKLYIYIYHDSLKYKNHCGHATKSYNFYVVCYVVIYAIIF
jgi:hypothetical protein